MLQTGPLNRVPPHLYIENWNGAIETQLVYTNFSMSMFLSLCRHLACDTLLTSSGWTLGLASPPEAVN